MTSLRLGASEVAAMTGVRAKRKIATATKARLNMAAPGTFEGRQLTAQLPGTPQHHSTLLRTAIGDSCRAGHAKDRFMATSPRMIGRSGRRPAARGRLRKLLFSRRISCRRNEARTVFQTRG